MDRPFLIVILSEVEGSLSARATASQTRRFYQRSGVDSCARVLRKYIRKT